MPKSILFRSYMQHPGWKQKSAIGSCSVGKTNIVKKVLGAIYPTNLRHLAGLSFRILALAGALYAITGADSILAQQNQSGSVSDAKAEVLSISNEELKEFDADYMLRYGIMMKFFDEKNLPQATEYAQFALRSADLARPTDGNAKEQLRKVRSTSHHIIASELLERGDFSQALIAFKAAIEAERYAGGYYGIGLCFDRKREIENAFPYYAAAELMGGEEAQKAKDRLEILGAFTTTPWSALTRFTTKQEN